MSKKLPVPAVVQPVGFVHVFANEVAEILAIIRPFVAWPLLAIGAALLHHFWADSIYVTSFLGVSCVLVCVLVWTVTHYVEMPKFVHTVLTAVIVATVLAMVDVLGWNKTSLFAVLMVLPMVCLTWSIRGAIYEREQSKGQHLSSFFEQAGLPQTHMKLPKKEKQSLFSRMKATPEAEIVAADTGRQRRPSIDRRVTGTVHLPPGGIPDDVITNLRRVESAAGYPPGTLIVTPNTDHAGVGDVVMSDPRTIKNPVPYPGPSFIGGSIADPISVGLYQDGTETELTFIEMQLQIMGQTGSGKSLGAAWSSLAEIITRDDVIVWAVDVTKGMQTLGPLAPAIHRIATDNDEAKQLLFDVQAMIKPRTNYLAEKGLSKWQRGCGLKYRVVWLEEVPDIMKAVGKTGLDAWVRAIKAARSAGITFVWSLQRSDFSQVPTITRGQGARWCFGVADQKEAAFGLSTAQVAAKCEPQLWGSRKPGMSYLDAPSVPEGKIPIPLRTWYWGEDDSIIKAHALKFPASDKIDDHIALAILAGGDSESDEILTSHDPKPMGVSGGSSKREDASAAREVVRAWLVAHKDRMITAEDIPAMIEGTGYKRAWGYKAMREFTAEGFLTKTEDGNNYQWKVN